VWSVRFVWVWNSDSDVKVFQSRVMTISGLMRDEVTGSWRKLGNEELLNLFLFWYFASCCVWYQYLWDIGTVIRNNW
jgi:hypothetical protein